MSSETAEDDVEGRLPHGSERTLKVSSSEMEALQGVMDELDSQQSDSESAKESGVAMTNKNSNCISSTVTESFQKTGDTERKLKDNSSAKESHALFSIKQLVSPKTIGQLHLQLDELASQLTDDCSANDSEAILSAVQQIIKCKTIGELHEKLDELDSKLTDVVTQIDCVSKTRDKFVDAKKQLLEDLEVCEDGSEEFEKKTNMLREVSTKIRKRDYVLKVLEKKELVLSHSMLSVMSNWTEEAEKALKLGESKSDGDHILATIDASPKGHHQSGSSTLQEAHSLIDTDASQGDNPTSNSGCSEVDYSLSMIKLTSGDHPLAKSDNLNQLRPEE